MNLHILRILPRGFSLLELLVALAVSSTLFAGFATALGICRERFSANESIAHLQDAERLAISLLGNDIAHTGLLGFTNDPRLIAFVRGTAPNDVLATAEALRQPSPDLPALPINDAPAGLHDCGINFAVDVFTPVQASNNQFGLGSNATDCDPTATAGGARSGSDTLTVRFAAPESATARAGRLQIYASRLDSQSRQLLFADGQLPGPLDADHQVHDFEVRTYYVANDSVGRRGWPALRVKALSEASGSAQFRDEEVLSGVEDLQVEFVIENDAGTLTRYLTPEVPVPAGFRVIAARLWLRLRAEMPEPAFVDRRNWTYADVSYTPSGKDARVRRTLVMRTIVLRNAKS